MNLNQLAREICKREGGKVNLPIAQVKEVLRCLIDIAEEMADEGSLASLALAVQSKKKKSKKK